MKINVSEKPSEKYVFFTGIKNILQLAEKIWGVINIHNTQKNLQNIYILELIRTY